MGKRKYLNFIGCVVFALIVLCSKICAQDSMFLLPIKTHPLLSGNFGELRASHFHSGWDFKTEGREGVPVVCVQDGVLVRVGVSPTGYGRVLYVEHANGLTTVYGHLQRFSPLVERKVRALQYEKESFVVDVDARAWNISFSAGDTIAFSGNTGSSMGPHLHFEIRVTGRDCLLNPGSFFQLEDERAPAVRGVYIYVFSEDGVLMYRKKINIKADGKGKYSAGRVGVPAGRVGFGVFADDFMQGSWNKLGIFAMEARVDGRAFFAMRMDSVFFSQKRLVNELKDFDLYRKRETVYTTFGYYQNLLPGVSSEDCGFIELMQDSVVQMRFDLRDQYGNCSSIEFEVLGKAAVKGRDRDTTAVYYYCKEGVLWSSSNYSLRLESDATPYYILPVKLRCERLLLDSARSCDVFTVSEKEIPLLRDARLRLRGEFSEKSVLCVVNSQGKLFPLKTKRDHEGLVAGVGVLGSYTVVLDTVAPRLTRLKGRRGYVCFKIQDELSGVTFYRGEVNGKWCLFEYDAKKDLLFAALTEPVFKKGKNEVVLEVGDVVGNVCVLKTCVVK